MLDPVTTVSSGRRHLRAGRPCRTEPGFGCVAGGACRCRDAAASAAGAGRRAFAATGRVIDLSAIGGPLTARRLPGIVGPARLADPRGGPFDLPAAEGEPLPAGSGDDGVPGDAGDDTLDGAVDDDILLFRGLARPGAQSGSARPGAPSGRASVDRGAPA